MSNATAAWCDPDTRHHLDHRDVPITSLCAPLGRPSLGRACSSNQLMPSHLISSDVDTVSVRDDTMVKFNLGHTQCVTLSSKAGSFVHFSLHTNHRVESAHLADSKSLAFSTASRSSSKSSFRLITRGPGLCKSLESLPKCMQTINAS